VFRGRARRWERTQDHCSLDRQRMGGGHKRGNAEGRKASCFPAPTPSLPPFPNPLGSLPSRRPTSTSAPCPSRMARPCEYGRPLPLYMSSYLDATPSVLEHIHFGPSVEQVEHLRATRGGGARRSTAAARAGARAFRPVAPSPSGFSLLIFLAAVRAGPAPSLPPQDASPCSSSALEIETACNSQRPHLPPVHLKEGGGHRVAASVGRAHDVRRSQRVEPHRVAVVCGFVPVSGHRARLARSRLAESEDGSGPAGEDVLQQRLERGLVDGGVGVGLVEDGVEVEAGRGGRGRGRGGVGREGGPDGAKGVVKSLRERGRSS
jgi:hypothetical protein